jgi:hypothetical protein
MTTLNKFAAMKAKLLADDEKAASQGKGSTKGKDSVYYPFWNIPVGSTAGLRFVPDADPSNEFFWRENQSIAIPFSGTKGGDINKPVTVKVPCMEMWDEACPVLGAIRPWFKDPRMEEMARKYWKKRTYVFSGFVTANPLSDDSSENPLRIFMVNPSIFKNLKASLINDFDVDPTDFIQGTDFRLEKTQKGNYADYTTSSWARKERSLNEQELEAIAQYGLYNLSDFMLKKPNSEELNAIVEMFEASVDGELYDPARWSQFYKPNGSRNESTASTNSESTAPAARATTAAPKTSPAPKMESYDDPSYGEESAPAQAQASATAPKASVDDLLSMIRNRKTA